MEQREILFRAWDGQEMDYDIAVGGHSGDNKDAPNTVIQIDDGDCWFFNEPPFAVMQYTGSKDSKGQKIFEGDILTILQEYPYYDNCELNYVGIVSWVFSGWQLILKCVNSKKRGISDGLNDGYIETPGCYTIIGNVFLNPELLLKK